MTARAPRPFSPPAQRFTEAQEPPELFSSRRAHWQPLAAALLDLLFPPRCVLCGRVDQVWCRPCRVRVAAEQRAILLKPIPPLHGAMATTPHSGAARQVIRRFKYDSDARTAQRLAAFWALPMAAALETSGWHVDMLIPLPLHKDRQRERGYNQSQVLALALSAYSGIPAETSALERWRPTRPQVGLNRAARRQNVENAFRADPSLAAGRAILLIDDVCTTGATLAAAADALLLAQAAAVYSLTISAARATTPDDYFSL
ncbi:MAG: ComF family protein [bacterium]|nr:ComF family protein [bacterium]